MNGNISESLRKQRELIIAESGGQSLDRHTSLLEIAVISLYNQLANRSPESFRAGGAIAGTGLFGRGLSGPTLPVPLLCLQTDDSPAKDSWIEEITGPLMEAGWQVEAYQGSVEKIMELARAEFGFLLKLLDLRYISGNRTLADRLEAQIDDHIAQNRHAFRQTLRESIAARSEQLDNPRNWLEPDIEQTPGDFPRLAPSGPGAGSN